MKKLATLLLAAGMVLGSFAGAQAIDWKVRGEWRLEFSVTDGTTFSKNTTATQRSTGPRKLQYGEGRGRDTFQVGQRVDLWLDAVASENLSGSLRLEIGGNRWGTAGSASDRSNNGALGQRGVSVGVRNAYLDWFVPNTELKFRMGIQPLATPGFAFGPSVYGQDAAGITASYKFNDNASLVGFWIRAYNDNYTTASYVNGDNAANNNPANSLDNADFFGLVLPLSFDGFKVTPWGILGAIGPNVWRSDIGDTNVNGNWFNNTARGEYLQQVAYGLRPAFWDSNNRHARTNGTRQYGTAWWGGLTFDITAADPFHFAFDGVYGSVTYPDAGYMNRQGWFLAAVAEYKLDWGVPGLVFWWGSGDNGNPSDGSERMPVIDTSTQATSFSSMGFYGGWLTPNGGIAGTNVLGVQGFTGTWGIGARIRDMSFIEDLKHTIRVNFFGGTNDPQMAKYMLGKKTRGGSIGAGDTTTTTPLANNTRYDFNNAQGNTGVYLTTQDYGIEFNLDTSYKIYENLEAILELGYMHIWLDQSRSVWGKGDNLARGGGSIRSINMADAWKAALYFRYTF